MPSLLESSPNIFRGKLDLSSACFLTRRDSVRSETHHSLAMTARLSV